MSKKLERAEKKLETNNGVDVGTSPKTSLFRKYTYANGFKNVGVVQKILVDVINFEINHDPQRDISRSILKHLKEYFLETKDRYDILYPDTIFYPNLAEPLAEDALAYSDYIADNGIGNRTYYLRILSLFSMLLNVLGNYKTYGNKYYENLIAHLC